MEGYRTLGIGNYLRAAVATGILALPGIYRSVDLGYKGNERPVARGGQYPIEVNFRAGGCVQPNL